MHSFSGFGRAFQWVAGAEHTGNQVPTQEMAVLSPHSLTAERDVNSVMLVTATGKECTEIYKHSVEASVRERKFVRMSIPFTLLANTLYSLLHFARRGLFRVTGVTGQHAA